MSPPINLPDGTEVSEVILPDGATASEVIAPDGSTVVSAIPDSAIAQYQATDYDDNNDEWIDAINSFNLTGGSATKTTDSDGNTAVEYSGSTGQEHAITSVSLPYDRGVVAVVINDHNTSNDGFVWGDTSDNNVYGRVRDTTSYGLKTGPTFISGGTPDGGIHLLLFFAPEFGSSDEQVEVDGSSVVSAESGSSFLANGFSLGDAVDDLPLDGRVLEVVLYENPTQTEISDERDRLKNKYSGLSF